MTLMWGNIPVPWTVSWTGEERQFVGPCRHAGQMAMRMPECPGVGKPQFGKPHSDRQRQCIVEGRCDLCARSLQGRTKISLSHARVNEKGARGACVMQVEPMVHRECALTCLEHCPALKRDAREGALMIRQVFRFEVQIAIMGPQYIRHYVPDYVPNSADRIAGAAKVVLLKWRDRDEAWLRRAS